MQFSKLFQFIGCKGFATQTSKFHRLQRKTHQNDTSAAFGFKTFEPSNEQNLEMLDKIHSTHSLKNESDSEVISYLYALTKQPKNSDIIDTPLVYNNLHIDFKAVNITESCLFFYSVILLNLEGFEKFEELKSFILDNLHSLDSSNFNLVFEGFMEMQNGKLDEYKELFKFMYSYQTELSMKMLVEWMYNLYVKDIVSQLHENEVKEIVTFMAKKAGSLYVSELCYLVWMCVKSGVFDELSMKDVEDSLMNQELNYDLEDLLILITSLAQVKQGSRELWLHLIFLSSLFKESMNMSDLSDILWSTTFCEDLLVSDLQPLLIELDSFTEGEVGRERLEKNELISLIYSILFFKIGNRSISNWILNQINNLPEEDLEEMDSQIIFNFKNYTMSQIIK